MHQPAGSSPNYSPCAWWLVSIPILSINSLNMCTSSDLHPTSPGSLGVQRSQALQVSSTVSCIWSNAPCCFRGIWGIFTALLVLFVWLVCKMLHVQPNSSLALIMKWLSNYCDKHIFLVLFLCSIVLYMPIYSSSHQAGIHTLPLLSLTSKEVDGPCSGDCDSTGRTKDFWGMKGMILFCLDENQRTGGKIEKLD